jgi:hypothetical protein
MAFVKAGHRYYYNNLTGALYPWSPDLETVKGLTLFTARKDGMFELSMMQPGEKEQPLKPGPKAKPKAKTVKYVGTEDPLKEVPSAETATVPTNSGPRTIPAVKLTSSDLDEE